MIAVRMNRAMRPFGRGDIAMLPPASAQQLIDDGDAVLADMPAAPHAHEFGQGEQAKHTAAQKPARRGKPDLPKQTYLTKEG